MPLRLATRRLAALALGLALPAAALPTASAMANEFAPALQALAESEIRAFLDHPALIEAIRAQNVAHAGIAEARILELDAEWMAQVGRSPAPLIDAVLGNPVADHLRAAQEASGGLYTEIFVMDAVGLNVAASEVTSDYWQGDEAKWQQTYPTGGVHISDVELDESTQSYQAQVSIAILDPDTGKPIGAATVGVDVQYLQ